MAIVSLTYDQSLTAWETRALTRVDFCYISGGDIYRRSVIHLDANSNFALTPILRKNSFGGDVPVAYKGSVKVNPLNNKIADMNAFLQDLQDQKYTFLQVYFHKIPYGVEVVEDTPFIFLQSNARSGGSPNGIVVSKLTTSFSITNTELSISADFMLSKDAFATYQLFSKNS